MSRWKRFLRWWNGECSVEGCEKTPMRWLNRCEQHEYEAAVQVGREIAQEKFDRDAEVVAAGIKLAKERGDA